MYPIPMPYYTVIKTVSLVYKVEADNPASAILDVVEMFDKMMDGIENNINEAGEHIVQLDDEVDTKVFVYDPESEDGSGLTEVDPQS